MLSFAFLKLQNAIKHILMLSTPVNIDVPYSQVPSISKLERDGTIYGDEEH